MADDFSKEMKELDVVELVKDIPSKGLRVGMSGTIVTVYGNADTPQAYEIEFIDEDGNTTALTTVEPSFLKLTWSFEESKE